MIYLGKVLEIAKRTLHYKITTAVECGYHVDCYTLRVGDSNMINDLQVGEKIIFTGRWVTKDGDEVFKTESIMKRDFLECTECGLPLSSNTCFLKHDKEAQKLSGQWTIVHKIKSGGYIKIFFGHKHYVFAAVSFSKLWIHSQFQTLAEGDFVELEGWRYKQRTTIKYVNKIE